MTGVTDNASSGRGASFTYTDAGRLASATGAWGGDTTPTTTPAIARARLATSAGRSTLSQSSNPVQFSSAGNMPANLSRLTLTRLGGFISNRRQKPLALVASVSIHLGIAIALLMHWSHAPFGVAGLNLDTGVQVALVEGFSAGGNDVGEVAKLIPEADREQPIKRVQEAVPAGGTAQLVPAAAVLAPQEAIQEKRSASVDFGERGDEATDTEGASGSSDSHGGDPLATDLLNQIARCLPPTERPALMFSQLTLAIDDNGRLRSPPEVRSPLPRLTGAERLSADHIVQAALQCGPYNKPGLAGRVFSLAADFSSIQPAAVRGRKKGA